MTKISNLATAAQQYNIQKNEVQKEQEKKPVQPSAQKPVQRPEPKKTHSTKTTVASLAGSSIGIAATIALMLNKLKKGNANLNFSDLKFTEKDVLKLGAASISGGLLGGILTDKKENIKAKLKEANLQFFGNICVPVSLVALSTKIFKPDNIKMPQFKEAGKLAKLNPLLKGTPRIALTLASLIGGLSLGNKIMNKVNEKVFNEKEKRCVKPSDFSAHVDDLCFASTFLFKSPAITKFTSKVLPATYLIAGMETGTKTKDN